MVITSFIRTYAALYVIALVVGFCFGSVAAAFPETDLAPATQLVISLGAATCFSLWVCRDARHRNSTPCFDFGTFVFFTWFLSVPGYLIATRGWRGAAVAVTSMLTFFVAAIFTATLLLLLQAIFPN